MDAKGGYFCVHEQEREAECNEKIVTQSIAQIMLTEEEVIDTTGNDCEGNTSIQWSSSSWKKEARRRSQRQASNRQRQGDGEGLGEPSSRRVLDFQ